MPNRKRHDRPTPLIVVAAIAQFILIEFRWMLDGLFGRPNRAH